MSKEVGAGGRFDIFLDSDRETPALKLIVTYVAEIQN